MSFELREVLVDCDRAKPARRREKQNLRQLQIPGLFLGYDVDPLRRKEVFTMGNLGF